MVEMVVERGEKQDVSKIKEETLGALKTAAQQINAGQKPAAAGGGDNFNVITEGMKDALGPLGFAMTVASESLGSGHGTESSHFLMSPSRSKRHRRTERLSSKNDALGLPKSYSQMKADGKTLNRMRSGHVKRSKDPMAGNTTGLDAFGNKLPKGRKQPYLDADSLKRRAREFGLGSLADNLDNAVDGLARPPNGKIVAEALKGNTAMQSAARSMDKTVLFDMTTAMKPEARKQLLTQIAPPGPKMHGGHKDDSKGKGDSWN